MLTRRKHHCRCCGGVFCGDCADYLPRDNQIGLPLSKPHEHASERYICVGCASSMPPTVARVITYNPLYNMFRHLPLDIAFCFDATASMGPYIRNVEENIDEMVEDIHRHHYVDMHMGAVAYRDHQYGELLNNFIPMQNHHSKFERLVFHIGAMSAEGNDYPEAMAAGLGVAQRLRWRPHAVKMLVIITDAPPHGTGYPQDSYPQGDPTGLNPFNLVDQLAADGVKVYTIGVEPSSAQSGADTVLTELGRRGRGFYIGLQPHHHLHHQIAAIACTLALQGICSEELLIPGANPQAAAAAAFARMKVNTMPQLYVNNGVVTGMHREPMTADRVYNEYVTDPNLPGPPPYPRY